MKILIQDYSSDLFSEPLTLYQGLKSIGIETFLWSENAVSAYDIFDDVRPDVFITKSDFISNAIIKRLSEDANIVSIVRCKDKNEEQQVLHKIANCKVFSSITQPCNVFMENLLESNSIKIKYNINTLYIISNDSDLGKLIARPTGSYHIISIKDCDSADTVMSIGSIYALANNYKKVHVLIDNCEHIAMDFVILGNEVYYGGAIFPSKIVTSHTAFDLIANIFKLPEEAMQRISQIKGEKLSKFIDKLPKSSILEIPNDRQDTVNINFSLHRNT